MNRQVENLCPNLLRAERLEITGANERGDAVLHTIPIHKGTQGPWKLDIICCLKHCRTGRVDIGKRGVVQIQLHSHKLGGFMAIIDGLVLEWQKNRRVGDRRGIVDLTTSIVVEAENLK